MIFGNNPSVTDNQATPGYDAPLRRQNFPVAIPLLRAAIAREDARAMGAYGALCAVGHGVAKDLHEACCWFRQGATRCDVPSQLVLGMSLINGEGMSINKTEAAYWLYRSGTAGNRRAIDILEALAEKDYSVVGPHFTEHQLIRLIYASRKSACSNLPERECIVRLE